MCSRVGARVPGSSPTQLFFFAPFFGVVAFYKYMQANEGIAM